MPLPLYAQGTLYTLGYAQHSAAATLDRLLHQEAVLLLDIRYSPHSRWFPQWNRHALQQRFADRYCWDQRLGNLNYRQPERGIQLAPAHEQAVRDIVARLQGGINVILLCACAQEQRCHRLLVAKLVSDAMLGDAPNREVRR